jgi:hypothetical protein
VRSPIPRPNGSISAPSRELASGEDPSKNLNVKRSFHENRVYP